MNKNILSKITRQREEKQRIHGTGVDKNIQTDDITNSLTLDMLDVKRNGRKIQRECDPVFKNFLDSNTLNGAVDSFKDYVENSLI